MALSDIDDKPLYQRDADQIKYDLQHSSNKLMSETMSIANWLYGIIESEGDREKLTISKENIDKTRIATSQ